VYSPTRIGEMAVNNSSSPINIKRYVRKIIVENGHISTEEFNESYLFDE
jgi:hypothetical protein